MSKRKDTCCQSHEQKFMRICCVPVHRVPPSSFESHCNDRVNWFREPSQGPGGSVGCSRFHRHSVIVRLTLLHSTAMASGIAYGTSEAPVPEVERLAMFGHRRY